MDRLENLGNQLSQITMYDIKSYYNQAKNMVLNVSEMEAKVREATNDEPWGASSSLMTEIAQGTFNFQQFNEIMPCIYSKFMEKEARQWREIYKALQLLEYLIKHGSERVIDDARSHIGTVKMLRNFHYIDDKGKDQGINVRNRASEIISLLSDLDKVRAERRKAKANKNKYTGTGSDGFGSGYGGFGSDSYSGRAGGGGGGGSSSDFYSGGGSSSGFRDDTGRRGFEEYDAGDYDTRSPTRSTATTRSPTTSAARRTSTSANTVETKAKETSKPAVVEDLLGDWSEEPAAPAPPPTKPEKALPALASTSIADAGDDFDDFQSAPVSPPAPQVQAAAAKPTVFDFLTQSSAPAATPASPASANLWQQAPLQSQPMQPTSGTPNVIGGPMSPMRASSTAGSAAPRPQAVANTQRQGGHAAKPSGNFDDLWSMSVGSGSGGSTGPKSTGRSMKDLEKEKAQAGIWGTGAGAGQPKPATMAAGFGSFGGGGSSSGTTAAGNADDLLL